MAGEKFPGTIVGRVIETRFPFSGTIKSVSKQVGETVKPGEVLAALDKSVLQKELDVQLADYEQERAAFEIFHLKNTATDAITTYQKTVAQAKLNTAVKAVELAKARLDQTVLVSPVTGLVIDLAGIVPGLNITPSGSPVQILDFAGFTFRIEIPQEKLSLFRQPHRARIHIPNFGEELVGVSTHPLPAKTGIFVSIYISTLTPNLLPGLSGESELLE